MKTAVNILVAAAVLALVVPAWADFDPRPTHLSTSLAGREAAQYETVLPATAVPVGRFADSSSVGREHTCWLDECPGEAGDIRSTCPNAAGTDPVPGDLGAVLQMPELPDSSSLFLSALLSAGAFHLARRTKSFHLTHLPAWYHEACPRRIGHAVAFDVDLADMPVCFTAELAATDPPDNTPASHQYLRESRSRIRSQFILPVIAPRGPPSLCS